MKVEKMKKNELDEHCKSLGIDTKKKKKTDLIVAVYEYENAIKNSKGRRGFRP